MIEKLRGVRARSADVTALVSTTQNALDIVGNHMKYGIGNWHISKGLHALPSQQTWSHVLHKLIKLPIVIPCQTHHA